LTFGAQQLFDGVSFNIHSRERIGLVGRNGSGKTTIFKIITGEVLADSGKISLPKNYTVGYVQQHLNFTEPTILQEACLGLKEEEKDEVWKAEKILAGLGFSEEDFERAPAEVSGGYQVRLNLTKCLLAEPHLLLLDEPTNYLDIISIRWLIAFLRRWPNELILITHDRNFMDSVTTHTMALHRMKVKKIAGGTAKLYEQIATEEEVYENTRIKEAKTREKAEEFISRFRAQAARASLVQSRIKALEKMGEKRELSKIAELGFSFRTAEFKAEHLMKVKNITFGYQPDHPLIKDLSVEIGRRARICVVGKNGKGKSTLLRLLQGELAPQSGEITYHDKCQRGYFGQTNIERLSPELSIDAELGKVSDKLKYSEIRAVCGAMMFSGDLALKKISILSGGEKSRVSLGKILLTPTNLLLLDEPTNHLDMESCDSLIAAIDDFEGAVVIVTHNEMFLHHLATRLIVFNEEKAFLFDGSYQEFLDKIGWEDETSKKRPAKAGPGPSTLDHDKQVAEKTRQIKQKNLRKKIEEQENKIEKLEKTQELNHTKLAVAAAENQSLIIKELQLTGHKLEMQIKLGYTELEKLIEELDHHT
jgi:ATP-binding cassette subfamily F protein 3